jgi:hypothetical protein
MSKGVVIHKGPMREPGGKFWARVRIVRVPVPDKVRELLTKRFSGEAEIRRSGTSLVWDRSPQDPGVDISADALSYDLVVEVEGRDATGRPRWVELEDNERVAALFQAIILQLLAEREAVKP